MKLFVLFLLVVKSYATCPAGQFYLVEFKESGSCDTHISQSTCSSIGGGNAPFIVPSYQQRSCSYSPYYHCNFITHSVTSKYSPGCQIQTYQSAWGSPPVDSLRYGQLDKGFTGDCANTFYNEQSPCDQYGCKSWYNQGGTNCLCAPNGETDAICISECPAGTARRNADDVTWDSCDAIPGCTNPHANNYNPNANTDDGTCELCDIENGEFFLIKPQTSGTPCDIGADNCAKLLNYGNGALTNPMDRRIPRGCNVATQWTSMYNSYSDMSHYYDDNLPCGYFEGSDPICSCSNSNPDECYTTHPTSGLVECISGPGTSTIRQRVYEYDATCLCMPDGQTELQCMSECPEEPLYNIEKVRRSRDNEPGVSWDGCSIEIEGCPNPLFKEYNSSHTSHAPYLLTSEDGTKYVNPIACHTLTCETLDSGFDNYCLPEGEC